MFVGRQFSEETLLGLAYAFEQATQISKFRTPCIRPTADVLPAITSSVSNIHALFGQVKGHLAGQDGLGA